VRKFACLFAFGIFIFSVASTETYAQAAKAKTKANARSVTAGQPKNEILTALQAFCSLHATLKDLEILGLSFVPGAASIPAIVSAVCSVLNTQLASNSNSLTAPPSDLPVNVRVSVPITDPTTGKTETARIHIRGVFNPIK
jgi:hypothetical protein